MYQILNNAKLSVVKRDLP